MSRNFSGRKPFRKEKMNFPICSKKISKTFRMKHFLNKGSVCASNLHLIKILIARFSNKFMRRRLFWYVEAQTTLQYSM